MTHAGAEGGALAGIGVLDLTGSVAGQACARLFADNGAHVLLVEAAAGAPTRMRGPSITDSTGRSWSALFWHLNVGKERAAAGLGTDLGEEVVDLLARADVVVVDEASPALPVSVGGGPRVIVRITPFGGDAEPAEQLASELTAQALSGTMHENGAPDREPLYGVGHRASWAAALVGYTEAVSLLLAGDPVRRTVDVSIVETAASMSFCRATQYSYNGTIEGRASRTTPRAVVPCADGWVSVFIYDHRWRDACRGLGLDDMADDPRFATETHRLANWDAFTAELAARLLTRPADEIVAAGQRERAVVARALRPSQLRDDPTLLARGWWDRTVAHPDGPPLLGPMFRLSATPQPDPGGLAPEPSPITATAFARRPVITVEALASDQPARDSRPLGGLRVLDLTTAWSGPMTTRILASLGAEVLKVEGPSRIDDWRGPLAGGLATRYPDLEPGERPWDRCFQFNTQNHDKRGLSLDLKDPRGLAVARELAAVSDVLIANFSVGTLDRMGLGHEALREHNPRLIVVEMPAYGAGGPISHHVALGPTMELTSGMAALIGYGDGRPFTTGPAYLDPIGGFNGAAAVLTALAARARTGEGQHVEMAQREAAMHWIGEEIVAAVASGVDRTPRGNRSEAAVPHDAFPCAGDDSWVALAAHTDAQFAMLWSVIGGDPWRAGPGGDLSTLDDRRKREDELAAVIAAWSRPLDRHEAAGRLRAAGLDAAPVCDARDIAMSRFLRGRGLLQQVAHPACGVHAYQGMPLHIDGLDLTIRRPAPCFGQDTVAVLHEVLGMQAETIEELERDAVVTNAPRRASGG